jgi:type I restriction enzyme, R subunit
MEELFQDQDTITVDPSALERRFTIPERNRALVREFREVLEKGYTGRDGVRRAPMDGKTIVFAVTKRHAATLAQMLDAEFAHKKPSPEVRYADFVVSGIGAEEERAHRSSGSTLSMMAKSSVCLNSVAYGSIPRPSVRMSFAEAIS